MPSSSAIDTMASIRHCPGTLLPASASGFRAWPRAVMRRYPVQAGSFSNRVTRRRRPVRCGHSSKVARCPRAQRRSEQGRTHYSRRPAEEMLHGGTTHGPLAGAHPDTGVQLGLSSGPCALEAAERNILAATDHRVSIGKVQELGPHLKGIDQTMLKATPQIASTQQRWWDSRFPLGCSGKPRDLTLGDRCLVASDTGALACTIDSGDRGLLERVHRDRAILDGAAEQPRELGARHETVAATEQVTRLCPALRAIGERHRLDASAAIGSHHPGACTVCTKRNRRAVPPGEDELGRLRQE